MHPERRNDLQNPVCEDSGVASGELGEPSCSVDCDGVCVIRNGPRKKESEEHHDPRYRSSETDGIIILKSGEKLEVISRGCAVFNST